VIVGDPALPASPAIEEAAFGQFLIVGDHDIELAPFAPRQRRRLAASNPIRMAIRTSTMKIVPRLAPSADIPKWTAIIRTIQPSSASHSRCHNNQITLATAAQKWKPSRTKTNRSVAGRSAPLATGACTV
jgi:hypothetical protein